MFGFFNARFVEAVRLTMLVAALGFFLYGCTGRNPEKAFDKGDYLTAARLWLERAERGDRTALCPMIAALNVIHNTAKVQALWDRQQALDLLDRQPTLLVQHGDDVFPPRQAKVPKQVPIVVRLEGSFYAWHKRPRKKEPVRFALVERVALQESAP